MASLDKLRASCESPVAQPHDESMRAAAQIEILVLDWFTKFLELPASTRGVLTGGGSEANLTALVTAREQLADSDRGRAVIYFSEHRHWSIDRAAKVMGVRPEQLRPI